MTRFEAFRLDDRSALLNVALKEFAWDGSFRDIYVEHTTTDDWQKLINHIGRSEYPWQFKINDRSAELPTSLSAIFEVRSSVSPSLSVLVDTIDLRSHLFWEEEIDFDLDPRQVKGERSLVSLFRLLSEFSNLLGKPVILTPEGGQDFTIFRITPGSELVEHRLSDDP